MIFFVGGVFARIDHNNDRIKSFLYVIQKKKWLIGPILPQNIKSVFGAAVCAIDRETIFMAPVQRNQKSVIFTLNLRTKQKKHQNNMVEDISDAISCTHLKNKYQNRVVILAYNHIWFDYEQTDQVLYFYDLDTKDLQLVQPSNLKASRKFWLFCKWLSGSSC